MRLKNKVLILVDYMLVSLVSLFFLPVVAYADFINPRAPQYQSPYRNFDPTFFPKCPLSRGSVVAFHPTGTHGIPGDFTTHFGSDLVFSLGNNNFLQCFCPVSGPVGIQVDWLATQNLSQAQIDSLLKSGWYLVPNGADWGLSEQPYLTYNITQIMCVRPPTPL